MGKPAPIATPETQVFWDGTREGELRLQRCNSCRKAYYPPRPFCPSCASRDVQWFRASGRGTLYSYVINHRPRPGWPQHPHSIALVQLAEGPMMVSNVIGVPQQPAALVLDMALMVDFEPIENGCVLPVFRPAPADCQP